MAKKQKYDSEWDVGPCHVCKHAGERKTTVFYPDGKSLTFPTMGQANTDARHWQPDEGDMPEPRIAPEFKKLPESKDAE